MARLVCIGLEGAAGHEHDVALQPPGHGHVPGRRQAWHPDPEEHPAQRDGVLAQSRQVLVGRRNHRVPPRLVETLHRVNVIEEALLSPGLQEFVRDHLTQRRCVEDTHLQLGYDHISCFCSLSPAYEGQFFE